MKISRIEVVIVVAIVVLISALVAGALWHGRCVQYGEVAYYLKNGDMMTPVRECIAYENQR